VFSVTEEKDMYYTTKMNHGGRTYQLTFDQDSAESPGWMEASSYLTPTINLSCQLNRQFLDTHAGEVLARWGKDHLIAFCTALRLMGARDADFARLGLESPAEAAEREKQQLKEKKSQERRRLRKLATSSDKAGSTIP
jgi:hypothetical protein